jgi:hypothetical protein
MAADSTWHVKAINVGGCVFAHHSCCCCRIGAFGLRPTGWVLWIIFIDIGSGKTGRHGDIPVAVGVCRDGCSVSVGIMDQHIHIGKIRLVC